MKRGVIPALLGFVLFVSLIGFASADHDFSVNNLLLKISVKEGGSVQRTFNINSVDGGQFNVKVEGIENVELTESDFVLGEGATKPVILSFDSFGVEKGVYVGNIEISSTARIVTLPVIIEVESRDVFFDINLDISPQYGKVSAGQQFVANLKVFDLVSGSLNNGLGPTSVDLNYFIYSIDGDVIISEEESVVVDKQTQFTKTIELPKDAKGGDYVFVAEARYASSVGTSSYLFAVGERKGGSIFQNSVIDGGISANLIAVLVAIIIVFFGIAFIFIYFIKDRDKLFLKLKKYHSDEIEMQRALLLAQASSLRKKGVSHTHIRKEIKRHMGALKEKQKKRREEFSVLRKKGDRKLMEKKLEEWKRAGYYTLEIGSKLGRLGKGEMKRIMNNWKKKYNVHN